MQAGSQSWPAAGKLLGMHPCLSFFCFLFTTVQLFRFFLDAEWSSTALAGPFDWITGELMLCWTFITSRLASLAVVHLYVGSPGVKNPCGGLAGFCSTKPLPQPLLVA